MEFTQKQRNAQNLTELRAGVPSPAGRGGGWDGDVSKRFLVGWCLRFKSLKTEGELAMPRGGKRT